MRRMPKIFILGAIFFAFCASTPGHAFTGEIVVGSVSAAPGEQAVVPVYLQSNDIDIASLTVPLKYSSSDLEVDSISFAGSLLKPGMSPLVNIDNGSRFLRFTYYPSSSSVITETEGLLATIYFSVNVSAAEQTVSIDSIYKLEYAGPPQLWIRLEVADTTGQNLFIPGYSAGEVSVLSPMDAGYDQLNLPTKLELKQNFPNPFNPSTTIAFSVPERSPVNLTVYNILGQSVETLVDEVMNAGSYEINWQASDKASGIYFYRLVFKDQVLTKKMALLK